MLLRLLTALIITSAILLVLYLQNSWIFASVILFICLAAYYEWISNKFKNKLFGFFLIFNFGFWSIFMIFGWEVYFDNNLNCKLFLFLYILLQTKEVHFGNFQKTYFPEENQYPSLKLRVYFLKCRIHLNPFFHF